MSFIPRFEEIQRSISLFITLPLEYVFAHISLLNHAFNIMDGPRQPVSMDPIINSYFPMDIYLFGF